MPNTTVTITYANGSTREFIASDDLERMINEGHMFSVTTMHSDMGVAEEMLVSKMYVGNPVAAMGHMIMMKRNAETMRKSKSNRIVKHILTTCIKLMSDEITSYQSEMSPVMDNEKRDGDMTNAVKCPVTDKHCEHYIEQADLINEVVISHCTHPDNPSDEGDCVSKACPLSEDFIPF